MIKFTLYNSNNYNKAFLKICLHSLEGRNCKIKTKLVRFEPLKLAENVGNFYVEARNASGHYYSIKSMKR